MTTALPYQITAFEWRDCKHTQYMRAHIKFDSGIDAEVYVGSDQPIPRKDCKLPWRGALQQAVSLGARAEDINYDGQRWSFVVNSTAHNPNGVLAYLCHLQNAVEVFLVMHAMMCDERWEGLKVTP
jgi:hypothetical protein